MSDANGDRETRRLYSLLTPDDWAAVSASVGYKCGPDDTGYIHPLQPALAISIAYDRDFGCLQGPLTSNYLKNLGANQPADLANQVGNALDFLQKKDRDDVDRAQRRRIDVLA